MIRYNKKETSPDEIYINKKPKIFRKLKMINEPLWKEGMNTF